MNIKTIIVLMSVSLNLFAGDVGHSMANELRKLKQEKIQKQRLPNKVDDKTNAPKKVHEMENAPIEIQVLGAPNAGPKY